MVWTIPIKVFFFDALVKMASFSPQVAGKHSVTITIDSHALSERAIEVSPEIKKEVVAVKVISLVPILWLTHRKRDRRTWLALSSDRCHQTSNPIASFQSLPTSISTTLKVCLFYTCHWFLLPVSKMSNMNSAVLPLEKCEGEGYNYKVKLTPISGESKLMISVCSSLKFCRPFWPLGGVAWQAHWRQSDCHWSWSFWH
jgi:hypothetical protein